jgi:hypothetical protein
VYELDMCPNTATHKVTVGLFKVLGFNIICPKMATPKISF